MQSDRFGDPLPFCEPYWYQGYPSPYYKQGHKDFRAKVQLLPPRWLLPLRLPTRRTGQALR
jgi:hypothetical protein